MKIGNIEDHPKGVWTQKVEACEGTEHTIRIVTCGDRFLGLVKHYEVDVDGHRIPEWRHRNREAAIRSGQEYVAAIHGLVVDEL